MLKRGACALMRLFSSSSASASERVTVVSMLAMRPTISAMRGPTPRLKYEDTRFLRSRALPTYSTWPSAASMR